MAEMTLTINGRAYGISCDDGQEQRVMDLGQYVDTRMKAIAKAGAARNDSHLLVLTALMLTDEIFELRSQVSQAGGQPAEGGQLSEDEIAIAQAIDHLADRIENIAERMKTA